MKSKEKKAIEKAKKLYMGQESENLNIARKILRQEQILCQKTFTWNKNPNSFMRRERKLSRGCFVG